MEVENQPDVEILYSAVLKVILECPPAIAYNKEDCV